MKFFYLFLTVLIMGCSTAAWKAENAAKINYLPPTLEEAKKQIRDMWQESAIDPDSTKLYFTINKLIKSVQVSDDEWSGQVFGWGLCYEVNSKNKMGGYSGRETRLALFGKNKEMILDGSGCIYLE